MGEVAVRPEWATARAGLPSFSAFLTYWRANPQIWADVPNPFLLVPTPAQPAARAVLFDHWTAFDARNGTTIADEYRRPAVAPELLT
jgi:hypothetical protein